MGEENAMGGLVPAFDTLEASGHLKMNKDQFFVCLGFEGHICIWLCVFNVNLVKIIDR